VNFILHCSTDLIKLAYLFISFTVLLVFVLFDIHNIDNMPAYIANFSSFLQHLN